jgi:hypothetical protein
MTVGVDLAKVGKVAPEEAFVVTIGVPHKNTNAFCRRALKVLEIHGFTAAQTSPDALLALAEQVRLTKQLEEND